MYVNCYTEGLTDQVRMQIKAALAAASLRLFFDANKVFVLVCILGDLRCSAVRTKKEGQERTQNINFVVK